MEKEITQWRRRNITPIGRITVIKSLLVSKFVHLFTALPDPSEAELKQLERLFFKFLWGGKRDPIKRAKVIQNYSHGGLRMLDLQAFVKSMKISWIKRLFTANSRWEQVIASDLPNIKEIFMYGSDKLLKMSANMNNPFWKNVLEAFAAFSSAFRPKMSQILSESIWFSDPTKFKCSIINDWNRKGIRFINDLIDVNSNKLHTKKGLKDSFNIKMTFLCFSSLMRSLPDELKSVEIVKESGPIMPLRMNPALNHPNFQRFAYNACIENRICDIARVNAKQKEKWIRDIGCFEDGSMVKVIKATKSTRSIMLHYKLVNRFLATNTIHFRK